MESYPYIISFESIRLDNSQIVVGSDMTDVCILWVWV